MNKASRILLVSPHADDVAYSLGGHLVSGTIPAEYCHLLTIFTRSVFAPYHYSDSTIQGEREISELRAREDEAFALKRGLVLHRMPLEEAPLRNGLIKEEDLFIYVDHHYESKLGDWIDNLSEILVPWVSRYEIVYGPLGLGGHFDHMLVRKALQKCSEIISTLRFYEDVPYAGEMPLNEYNRQISILTVGMDSATFAENGWLDEKLASLALYKSQIAENEIASVIEAICRVSGERVWF